MLCLLLFSVIQLTLLVCYVLQYLKFKMNPCHQEQNKIHQYILMNVT
jgi:hypothetical protein